MHLVTLLVFAWSIPLLLAIPTPDRQISQGRLAVYNTNDFLARGAPIFGDYVRSVSWTSNWMSTYPNTTLIPRLNIPGSHESATWNYTQATQDSLRGITDEVGLTILDPVLYRCQTASIIASLNAGIRFFDLRYALDTRNESLVFWHSQALLSATARLDDVMVGFYTWLRDHPTEFVFVSLQYEGSTTDWAKNDAVVQRKLFDVLRTAEAKRYIDPTVDELPANLGAARGKIVLVKRFVLDKLSPEFSAGLPGLRFSPSDWPDNSADFAITYNSAKGLKVFVEDQYEPSVDGAAAAIAQKTDVTVAHLRKAATEEDNSLFVTFASGNKVLNDPPLTPEILAKGNGTDAVGVNSRIALNLGEFKGKRIGIVAIDFHDPQSSLIEDLIKLGPSAK